MLTSKTDDVILEACCSTCEARFGRRSSMSTSAFAFIFVVFWTQHGISRAFAANAVYSPGPSGIAEMESNKTYEISNTMAADAVFMNSSDDHFDVNLECDVKLFNGTICHKGVLSQLRMHRNRGLALLQTSCMSVWENYVARFCRDDRQRVEDQQHKETVNHRDYTLDPGHRGIQAVVVERSSSGYSAALILGICALLAFLIAAVIVTICIRRGWRQGSAEGMDLSRVWPYRWFYSSPHSLKVTFHQEKPSSNSLNTVHEFISEPYPGATRSVEKNVFMGGKEVVRIKDGEKELMEYRYNHSFPEIKKRGDQEKLVFDHLKSYNVTSPHIVRRESDAVYQLDLHLYVEFWELGSVASFARSTEDKPGRTISLETGLRLIHHLLIAMSEFHGREPGNRRAHMDVKADNVLLRNIEGELVLGLADFDHAILEYQFDRSGTADFDLGQCRYRAPELLRIGRHAVRNSAIAFLTLQKSDIYSTALVIWEILEMCVFQDHLGRRTVINWGLAYEDRFEHLKKKDELLSLITPVVVDQGCRPEIPAVWIEHEVVAKVVELMKWMWAATWEDRPDARSALACYKQILYESDIHQQWLGLTTEMSNSCFAGTTVQVLVPITKPPATTSTLILPHNSLFLCYRIYRNTPLKSPENDQS